MVLAFQPQVDRKQVPADYNRKLQAIQAKAAEAVRELPSGFLGQFEGGPPYAGIAGLSALDCRLVLDNPRAGMMHGRCSALHRQANARHAPRDLHAQHAPLEAAPRRIPLRPCPAKCSAPPLGPAGGEDVPLDYFLATAVLGKLSETAEKGFLGSFKGAAGEWEKVVKAYEYNRELRASCFLWVLPPCWSLWEQRSREEDAQVNKQSYGGLHSNLPSGAESRASERPSSLMPLQSACAWPCCKEALPANPRPACCRLHLAPPLLILASQLSLPLLPAVMFVAEAAQTLARNGDYEIPFLKKQAAKAQQQAGWEGVSGPSGGRVPLLPPAGRQPWQLSASSSGPLHRRVLSMLACPQPASLAAILCKAAPGAVCLACSTLTQPAVLTLLRCPPPPPHPTPPTLPPQLSDLERRKAEAHKSAAAAAAEFQQVGAAAQRRHDMLLHRDPLILQPWQRACSRLLAAWH